MNNDFDKDEWGNLGNFDAKDPKAVLRATNRKKAKDKEWLNKADTAAKKRSQTKEWQESIKKRKIDYKEIDHTPTIKAQAVKCKTPWGEFSNIQEAAKAGGIHEETLRRRCSLGKPGYWKEDKHKGKKPGKLIQTPFGKFDSKIAAAKFASENNIFTNALNKISGLLKKDPENYYYLDE